MRRKDREVTSLSEIEEILTQCSVCSLAFHDEPFPYVVPVNFGMMRKGDDFVFYFHGAPSGKKMELMQKDPRVCLEAACHHKLVIGEKGYDCTWLYASVIAQGTLEIIENPAEKQEGLQILLRHITGKEFPLSEKDVQGTCVYKMTAASITGKRHEN